jgi:MFS family permease
MPKENGTISVVPEAESSASSTSKPVEVEDELSQNTLPEQESEAYLLAESKLRRKVDIRLCTIAGLLCSLNLLDSGIISSASVTSMLTDLDLTGNRYSVAIFIFTVSSIIFQLPSTILVRQAGPRIYFSCVTISFGIITLCTAFITTWKQMIALRVLLGMTMSGIYPGLSYLISTWYTRKEQQLRFAFLQTGEVIILATGSIANWGLNHLDHRQSLRGWQWMFLVQGIITTFLGLLTYIWMVDFPERSQNSFNFLTPAETSLAISRINTDRSDGSKPAPITPAAILNPFLDPKLYIFSLLFFLLNVVSTALSYFLPIILQSGMGFSTNKSILLSAPPYYYAVIPVLLTSYLSDKYSLRAPIIIFNALTLILGFCLLGFPVNVTVRYIGVYLATGAYISNWAALNAYQANNITGQWKRATIAAAVAACNGLGGIAGSYIVVSREAPRYMTAIWVSIGSHVVMIALVAGTTVGFWWANRRARAGRGVIEGVKGFRYTY